METLEHNGVKTAALEKPHPNADAILRIQGYKDLTKVRPRVRDIAEKSAAMLTEIATPTVCYRIVGVESIRTDELVLENDIRMRSVIFNRYFQQAQQAIVFVLTVGHEVDRHVIRLMDEESLVEALFLEGAAWLGLENATKQFVIASRNWANSENMRITRRLGPGYSYPINGDRIMWDLTDQHSLFAVFGDARLPVELMESSAMLPKMSRSGMYGVLPR